MTDDATSALLLSAFDLRQTFFLPSTLSVRLNQDAFSVSPPTLAVSFFCGELTEREKSMMYLTVFEQNRHAVSHTSEVGSSVTFIGNDRRHSVQVTTI